MWKKGRHYQSSDKMWRNICWRFQQLLQNYCWYLRHYLNSPLEKSASWTTAINIPPLQSIMQHISTLKNKKSVGIDCIERAVLKKASQFVSPYLKTAINECIYSCVFPQGMRNSKVMPFFKAGETNLPSNYRPISIHRSCSSGNSSKLFE